MKIVADTNIPFVSECFEHVGDVEVVAGREITANMLADADVLLVRSITKVNEELLAESSVKFVATATIGVDHIDQDYLASRGIGFSSAPGSNANGVAEYIVASLLEIAEKNEFELSDKSIGIIGVGNVGSRVERKVRSLGMKVVLNDPPLKRETGDEKYRPIEEVYDCDIITIHTPLTREGEDATYHLADERFFDSLKDGAFLLNSARGPVVETGAIKKSLSSGKLAGAVLDVWEFEPEVDQELLDMVDVATPHIAGYSYDGKIAGLMMIYEACCDFFGIEKMHTADDFLPRAIVAEIDTASMRGAGQREMREIVAKIYNIMIDDADMRRVGRKVNSERGAFFDYLRKSYPIRREFQNTLVSGATDCLRDKLEGIGFRL